MYNVQTDKKADKKVKDPNAPKKPLTPYFQFLNSNRQRIKDANPGASFGELNKILGAEWKALSDAEKAPYVKATEKDKLRYEKEVKAYKGE
ncbi:Non-histone chromosomal protein 6 [Chytridiales sp. JEL 0842]|nr:Non-histone chromosomal protein 6 [Chytridiales sp. JEL 0842]